MSTFTRRAIFISTILLAPLSTFGEILPVATPSPILSGSVTSGTYSNSSDTIEITTALAGCGIPIASRGDCLNCNDTDTCQKCCDVFMSDPNQIYNPDAETSACRLACLGQLPAFSCSNGDLVTSVQDCRNCYKIREGFPILSTKEVYLECRQCCEKFSYYGFPDKTCYEKCFPF